MARPNKEGMDYFPFNVDFFEDDKLQLIEAEFGEKGLIITIKLLCKIYKENGYYYQWGDDQCLLFSKNAGKGIVPSLVNEVINGLVRRSFFDKRVFDKFKILTSSGIQKRYFEATKKRTEVTVLEEIIVIDNINSINSGINSINSNINTQSKEKEIKEKESIAASPKKSQQDIDKFSALENWIKNHSPNVGKMKEPFTIDQYLKLKESFSSEQIKEMLLKMHNYKPLVQKNISAYLTFLNWHKRDYNSDSSTPKVVESKKLSDAVKAIEKAI